MRQRGYSLLAYLIAGGVCLALLVAGVRWVYTQGRLAERAELTAQALERDRNVGKALLREEAKKLAGDQRAAAHNAKWKETRREAQRNRTPMGSAQPALAGMPAQQGEFAAGPAAGSVTRLHWRFVGLHDGAFTGLDGEPLFADSAAYAADPARADTPSPYSLEDDAVDVIGENAQALSTCRREYFRAVVELEAAAKAWDEANR